MIHKLHKMSEKYTECNRKNSENDLYELFNYCLHNINGSIRWLYSASELILHRDAKTCIQSDIYRFFILALVCFMPKCSLLCFSVLFQRVLSCKCVIVCLFSCTHARHTLLSLCLCSNSQRNTLNNGSKDQNLCLLVEYGRV